MPPVANRQKKVFGETLFKELEFRCMYHWSPFCRVSACAQTRQTHIPFMYTAYQCACWSAHSSASSPTRVEAIVPMQQTYTQGACVHSDGGRFVPAGTQQTRSEEVATGRCRLTTALTPRSSRLHYASPDSICHRYTIRAINGSCLIRHHT